MHKDGALIVESHPLFMHYQPGHEEGIPAVLVLHFSEQQCLTAVNNHDSLARELLGMWGYYPYPHSSLFTLNRGPLPATNQLGVSFDITRDNPNLTSKQLAEARDRLHVAYAYQGRATARLIQRGGLPDYEITAQRIVQPHGPFTQVSHPMDAEKHPHQNIEHVFCGKAERLDHEGAFTKKDVYDSARTALAHMNAFLLEDITFS